MKLKLLLVVTFGIMLGMILAMSLVLANELKSNDNIVAEVSSVIEDSAAIEE